jgi:hypothetical protein
VLLLGSDSHKDRSDCNLDSDVVTEVETRFNIFFESLLVESDLIYQLLDIIAGDVGPI